MIVFIGVVAVVVLTVLRRDNFHSMVFKTESTLPVPVKPATSQKQSVADSANLDPNTSPALAADSLQSR